MSRLVARLLTRRRGERGSMLVEFTWLGILLLIPLTYLLISVFEVQRGAFAVAAASRAAGRAYAVAPTEVDGRQRAHAAVRLALADQGLDRDGYSLEVDCDPSPRDCLAPGATITVRVASRVDLPLMPPVFGDRTPSVRVASSHSVPRGRFRSER